MPAVVIENFIINSPFDEPTRHFRFSDEGITNEVVEGRQAMTRCTRLERRQQPERQRWPVRVYRPGEAVVPATSPGLTVWLPDNGRDERTAETSA